jgi:hypothetical protein
MYGDRLVLKWRIHHRLARAGSVTYRDCLADIDSNNSLWDTNRRTQVKSVQNHIFHGDDIHGPGMRSTVYVESGWSRAESRRRDGEKKNVECMFV